MTADYMSNLMEGVGRMLPYLDKTAPVSALRKIALTPVEGRGTFWREPTTFKMESRRGFRMRAVIPELQMGKRREDTKLAFQRYVTKRRSEPRKGGYEPDAEEMEEEEAAARNGAVGKAESNKKAVVPPGQKRKYPAGDRLSRSGRNLAINHTPTSKGGTMYVCWDFNAHGGCRRGVSFPNVHSYLRPSGLHYTVLAELYRRGGHKSNKSCVEPQNVNGRVQELREGNVRKDTGGCRREEGKSSTKLSGLKNVRSGKIWTKRSVPFEVEARGEKEIGREQELQQNMVEEEKDSAIDKYACMYTMVNGIPAIPRYEPWGILLRQGIP